MKNKDKLGVTIVILVITIIVMGILLTAIVVPSSNLIDNSSVADFSKTITDIRDKAVAYNVTNGTLPVKTGGPVTYDTIYSKISNENGTEAAQDFETQIVANGDQSSKFYYIDFAKINVIQSKLDVDGNVVINSEGTHVYYIPGMYISEIWYFTDYTYNNN